MKQLKKITLLDTSFGSKHFGDYIVMDYLSDILYKMLPDYYQIRLPMRMYPDAYARDCIRNSELVFVCGTNALSSRMGTNPAWPVNWYYDYEGKLVLFGVGWNDYQGDIDTMSQRFFENALSKDFLHSVRDEYTADKLRSIGISNVANTSCPTLWDKISERINFRENKRRVLVTTNYYRDSEDDISILSQCLNRHYEEVTLMLNSPGDYKYARYFDSHFVPNMKELNEKLEGYYDYIGTRLHTGIHALHKTNSAIIRIDNRANEISKDYKNLPVVDLDFVLSSLSNNKNLSTITEMIFPDTILEPVDYLQNKIDLWKINIIGGLK